MRINKKAVTIAIIVFITSIICLGSIKVMATPTVPDIPKLDINITKPDTPKEYVDNIKILLLMTVLTLLPSIIIMTTCFVRIIVVFSLLKNAMGTQQAIPREVLIGLALFLTLFIMYPTMQLIKSDSIDPYLNGNMTQEVALTKGAEPLRKFMLKQTKTKDLKLFLEIGDLEDTVKTIDSTDSKNRKKVEYDYSDVPIRAIIPAFMISELKTAFEIGFLLYIPFLIIDLVTGSILMSMGMMMIPPVMISLPFKILIFVMVDGWNLLVRALILSFR